MSEAETYVDLAIEEARKAAWPFGAVIAKNGEVISTAGSGDGQDETHDPTAHAETNAIRRAALKLGSGDLSGCILYSSCEPCTLCFGAAWYAGIKKIFYGTSLEDIAEVDGKEGHDLGFPHDHLDKTGISFEGGILRNQALEMYRSHSRLK
jgi:guanine deaminase